MNAKALVIALSRAIDTYRTTHEPDRLKAEKEISELRHAVYLNSQKIWLQRTHNASESIHLNELPHVYREMFVPFNAVRAGLKKHGFDPDQIGLTEGYLLQDAIDRATYRAHQMVEGCDVKYSTLLARHDLERLLVTLKAIGISDTAPEILKIKELLVKVGEVELKPLRELVTLVDESLSLRKLAEEGHITRGQEQRLIGVAAYIYRSGKELLVAISALPPAKREVLLGPRTFYALHCDVAAAGKRYTTMAEKAETEKAAEEERLAQEELELWRKVAQVECRHRYGHDNAVLSNDYDPDGHFYAGQEETYWLVHPDHETLDPGVSAVTAGSHCLCHYHKLSSDRFIPRTYTAPTQAT